MCFRPPAIEIEKKCDKCDTKNSFDAEVCSECGAPLPRLAGAGAPGAPAPGAGAPSAPTIAVPRPSAPPATPKQP